MKDLSIRTFKVEVTPPIGDYLCGGMHQQSLGIETPLFLRGLLVSTSKTHYVIAVVDFCYLAGRSHRRLQKALADAAQIPAEQVTLQSTHVHDAPLINEEAHELITGEVGQLHNEIYFQRVIDDMRAAVVQAMCHAGTAINSIAFSQHEVQQFASTRRVLDENNRCHTRWSRCKDDALRNAPEGLNDPMLDQVVFYSDRSTPVACLNFFACHPQVADGRRMISRDAVGVACDLFERTNPNLFTMYFTGCAGDITAGKYSTLNPDRNRLVFGVRLFDAMQGAFEKAETQPLYTISWIDYVFGIPLSIIEESPEHFQTILHETAKSVGKKYIAATKLFRLQNDIKTYRFRISRLRLNEISMLFMPAEMVIGYQLFAKSQFDGKLAVAAYGDGFLKYVPTDAAFAQGGYEVNPDVTEVAPGVEAVIRDGIKQVLDRK